MSKKQACHKGVKRKYFKLKGAIEVFAKAKQYQSNSTIRVERCFQFQFLICLTICGLWALNIVDRKRGDEDQPQQKDVKLHGGCFDQLSIKSSVFKYESTQLSSKIGPFLIKKKVQETLTKAQLQVKQEGNAKFWHEANECCLNTNQCSDCCCYLSCIRTQTEYHLNPLLIFELGNLQQTAPDPGLF